MTRKPTPGKLTPRVLKIALCLLFVAAFLNAEPVSRILDNAVSLLGNPYRTGGVSPGGFDCSGYVSYLYLPTVPGLPRISRDMARTGLSVESGAWQPGDLLFYATGADPSRINHVAIWFGNDTIIHSISDGPETGVVLTASGSRYWSRRYMGARRVLPTENPVPVNPLLPPAQPVAPEPVIPVETVEDSPWDDFDGILRGDFGAWQQADENAFEAYKRENG